MAKGRIISYRPQQDIEGDLSILEEWCNLHGYSVNSVLNSFLPAIAYAVTRQGILDEETGKFYVRADFGDIFIRPFHYRSDSLLHD